MISKLLFQRYNDEQYPDTIEIAYPKAGTTNPTVKYWVNDVKGGTTKELLPDLPTDGFK